MFFKGVTDSGPTGPVLSFSFTMFLRVRQEFGACSLIVCLSNSDFRGSSEVSIKDPRGGVWHTPAPVRTGFVMPEMNRTRREQIPVSTVASNFA